MRVRVDSSEDFVINVHKLQQTSLIIVRGEIDLANIHILADAVDHLVRREVPLLFDLTKVRYIDTVGLHFLRRVHEQCARQHVPFAVVTNRRVRRVCGLFSLDTLIPMFPNMTLARDNMAADWGCLPSAAPAV